MASRVRMDTAGGAEANRQAEKRFSFAASQDFARKPKGLRGL